MASCFAMGAAVHIFAIPSVGAVAILLVVDVLVRVPRREAIGVACVVGVDLGPCPCSRLHCPRTEIYVIVQGYFGCAVLSAVDRKSALA